MRKDSKRLNTGKKMVRDSGLLFILFFGFLLFYFTVSESETVREPCELRNGQIMENEICEKEIRTNEPYPVEILAIIGSLSFILFFSGVFMGGFWRCE